MFIRALLAFLVLPGTVGFLAPPLLGRLDPWRGASSAWGWPLWLLGLFILLSCVRDFYVAGKGTLAPWRPPKQLVTVGLYRYCRNPMYVGVVTLVLGWAWLLSSPVVALYAVAISLIFHGRVLLHEEPWLRREFSDSWPLYARQVPRWWPRWPR